MTGESSSQAAKARQTLQNDVLLGPVVSNQPLRTLDPAPDPFRRLCRSIVRQQISMSAAGAIFDTLQDRVELSPAGIQQTDSDELTDAGLSATKARTIRELAIAWEREGWDETDFSSWTDDEIVAALTDVYGIGPWTANMALMFCFTRPDVFPVEDLGIRRAMNQLHSSELDRVEMRTIAQRWAPFRSYAALYLWRMIEESA